MRLTIILVLTIAAAGIAGAFIGYSIVDIQCHGACSTPRAAGGLSGLLIASVGVGVVGNLVVRAFKEMPRSRNR